MSLAQLEPVSLEFSLQKLIDAVKHDGNLECAARLASLYDKYTAKTLTVACCGYTSAGKSELLNYLSGENLLPVSPLPSSMNTVHIRPGRPLLTLCDWGQSVQTVNKPEPTQILNCCQDKKVSRVEIDFPLQIDFQLIDTPGIDSIETGESIANNPDLWSADLVLYVTDYNHVQSETNFSSLKALQEREIPFCLIINQIDKHAEWELSLAEFRSDLLGALKQWGLNPTRVFLTSLHESDHPGNELPRVEQTLSALQRDRDQLTACTISRAARLLVKKHGEFLSVKNESLKEDHLWALDKLLSEQNLRSGIIHLEAKVEHLESLPAKIATETMQEVTGLLENAPLFSFATRELAKEFLLSQQADFKAGFWASAAKTSSEKARRLEKLHLELKARSEAHLTWHLRQILGGIPTRYELPDDSFMLEASVLNLDFTSDLLLQTLHPGASCSGEYLLNYTRELGDKIKTLYRQTALEWIERAGRLAALRADSELPPVQKQLAGERQKLDSYLTLKRLDDQVTTRIDGLQDLWHQAVQNLPAPSWDKVDPEPLAGTCPRDEKSPALVRSKPAGTTAKPPRARGIHPKLQLAADKCIQSADLTAGIVGFNAAESSLRQRAVRLENSLFTVALFGAFSAGKSSLANALLGDMALPVSPNPTTAAINKILPPTPDFPHGTVRVKLKTVLDLTSDLLVSLAMFNLTANSLQEALLKVQVLDSLHSGPEAKPHLSFLKAVAQGLPDYQERLGRELVVDFPAFREFVVQEHKACLLEWIELYYDCPLTELGVILVDTPGSNSTNSRHTGVAFDYIKNADAVLFVTYFNNAFCKADAQFLSQLGKVKDSFELDKMFFLVNASDLAQSKAELAKVVEHVQQNLGSCGVHRPRIYPVSSQLALLARLDSKGMLEPEAAQYRRRLIFTGSSAQPEEVDPLQISGFTAFEAGFKSFITQDLVEIAVCSASREIERTLAKVEGLLGAAQADEAEKARLLERNRMTRAKLKSRTTEISAVVEERSLDQEIGELFYYVNQRLGHRLPDLFNNSFFILAKPIEELRKNAVESCLKELLQELEVELAQEVRATSLRLEIFCSKLMTRLLSKYQACTAELEPECSLPDYPSFPPAAPPQILSFPREVAENLPAVYRGPKDWVSGGGRARMLDTLEKTLLPHISAHLSSEAELFKQSWREVFRQETIRVQQEISAEIEAYYSSLDSALKSKLSIPFLKEVQVKLAQIL